MNDALSKYLSKMIAIKADHLGLDRHFAMCCVMQMAIKLNGPKGSGSRGPLFSYIGDLYATHYVKTNWSSCPGQHRDMEPEELETLTDDELSILNRIKSKEENIKVIHFYGMREAMKCIKEKIAPKFNVYELPALIAKEFAEEIVIAENDLRKQVNDKILGL